MFTLSEFADPFPEGVVQSDKALAWTPEAVPDPESAAMPVIVAESVRSAGGLVSKLQREMVVCPKPTGENVKPARIRTIHFFIRRWLRFLALKGAPSLINRIMGDGGQKDKT